MLTFVEQVSDQDRVVGRHQAGVVHCPSEAGGLTLQCGVVHILKPFLIDLYAGVFTARMGRAKKAAD